MNKQTEFKLLGAGFFDSRYVFGNESGFVTKERCLSNYELEFFVENGGHLFVDGEVHEIVRGRALVGKPGQKRHSKLHFKAYYIHLKINDCYLRHFLDELPNIFEVHNDRVYEEIFLRITELNESDLYASHDAKSPVGFNPHSPHFSIAFNSFSSINKHLP